MAYSDTYYNKDLGNMSNHEEMTQKYSTFGDKLLQHCDVLSTWQNEYKLNPITVQLAPCEVCDSTCGFCSVADRPLKSYMPFKDIEQCLKDFALLGAKAVEITGGGNPLLYRDKETGHTINDIIEAADTLGLDVGIITNSHNLSVLKKYTHSMISWIRVSLIKLDEGKNPEDYNFGEFSPEKLAFSYIIYDETAVNPLAKKQTKTTKESIEKIAKLVELHPQIKFVRIAGNCLIKGNNQKIKEEYKDVLDSVDKYSKFFIKDIGNNDSPYDKGCYVGGVRPYIAPSPDGKGDYQVYICTSHVLQKRNYDLSYSLGSVKDILSIWQKMNLSSVEKDYPYEVNGNQGKNWCSTCKFCYYHNNNKLLDSVKSNNDPDRNFA
jgi:hypothetical protein